MSNVTCRAMLRGASTATHEYPHNDASDSGGQTWTNPNRKGLFIGLFCDFSDNCGRGGGSGARIRTEDRSVNSRLLYR